GFNCSLRFVTYCLAVTDDAVRQYDPRYDSAPGCRFGERALLFDPDSDPEQEIAVWTGQHQGGNTFRIPLPKSTKWTLQR
ncbi:MAG: hypothetical protein J6K03_08475, partial [Oscillospiraceae bacterium]|nr:hypothetical protein [Oscillospiraceae bacterium]